MGLHSIQSMVFVSMLSTFLLRCLKYLLDRLSILMWINSWKLGRRQLKIGRFELNLNMFFFSFISSPWKSSPNYGMAWITEIITICRISPQGFPTTYTIFPYRGSLWFLQPSSIDIAGKTYGQPVNTCKLFKWS